MTFEIKGLVDYRLDRVDNGEGTSRGTADTAANSSSSACVPMGWWIDGDSLACLLSW